MEVQTTISSYAAMQIFTGAESARGKLNCDGTISSCLVFMSQASFSHPAGADREAWWSQDLLKFLTVSSSLTCQLTNSPAVWTEHSRNSLNHVWLISYVGVMWATLLDLLLTSPTDAFHGGRKFLDPSLILRAFPPTCWFYFILIGDSHIIYSWFRHISMRRKSHSQNW